MQPEPSALYYALNLDSLLRQERKVDDAARVTAVMLAIVAAGRG